MAHFASPCTKSKSIIIIKRRRFVLSQKPEPFVKPILLSQTADPLPINISRHISIRINMLFKHFIISTLLFPLLGTTGYHCYNGGWTFSKVAGGDGDITPFIDAFCDDAADQTVEKNKAVRNMKFASHPAPQKDMANKVKTKFRLSDASLYLTMTTMWILRSTSRRSLLVQVLISQRMPAKPSCTL